MSDAHALLPWYVNGTLEAGERRTFEDHLKECARCAGELPVLEELRGQVRGPDWASAVEHPEPEALSRVVAEGEDDPAVRRHLALCLTCAEEARWLRGEEAASAGPGTAQRRRVSSGTATRRVGWPVPVAAAAAALLLLAAVRLLWPARPAGTLTGVSAPVFVAAAERDRDRGPEFGIAPDAAAIHIHFQVDLGPEELPAAFEVRDASGRVVFTKPDLRLSDLFRGVFLFTCARSDCPPGEYGARIIPAAGPAVDYPFRIVHLP